VQFLDLDWTATFDTENGEKDWDSYTTADLGPIFKSSIINIEKLLQYLDCHLLSSMYTILNSQQISGLATYIVRLYHYLSSSFLVEPII